MINSKKQRYSLAHWSQYVALWLLAGASLGFSLVPAAVLAAETNHATILNVPAASDVVHHDRVKGDANRFPAGELVVLGFVGDLGFSGKDQSLSLAGAVRHGRVIDWERLFSRVAPLLAGDATFANLETVVTDRADLRPVDKAFNFLASPAGLKEAIRAGINVIAAANNHAADYGALGIAETLHHLEAARADGLKGHAGLGKGDDRYRADTFELKGISISLGAIGKGINPAGLNGYGHPLYASPLDFDRVGRSLANTKADLRVLSVHYGEELNLLPLQSDKARFRSAIDRGDATIVFGHHSHVASGVERRGRGVIFYGLGNFLHAGTQNMARYGQCRDFGLHARIYLWVAPGNMPVVRAVEITPLKDMHEITKPFPAYEAAARIALVNAMSEELSRDGGDAVRFLPTGAGSGLACFPDPSAYGDDLEVRCKALLTPLLNVSVVPVGALSSCKSLPQIKLATVAPKAKAKPTRLLEQVSKKPTSGAVTENKKQRKIKAGLSKSKRKSARSFFLFSRAE